MLVGFCAVRQRRPETRPAHGPPGSPPTIRGPVHTYDSLGFVNVPITVGLSDIGFTRWFQFWFRDSANPDGTGTGLTDAVEVQFCQ